MLCFLYMSRSINLSLSNTLITIQNYVNKDKDSSLMKNYAVPVMAYPNDDTNGELNGPFRRARPMKHYRKRLATSTQKMSNRIQLTDFETPGSVINTNVQENCARFVPINHKLLKYKC